MFKMRIKRITWYTNSVEVGQAKDKDVQAVALTDQGNFVGNGETKLQAMQDIVRGILEWRNNRGS